MSLLRGTPTGGAPDARPNSIPNANDATFTVEPHPAIGIRFYPGRGAFFLPYTLLQSMTWDADNLVLNYAGDTVTLAGAGLHDLFVEIAGHRVSRIHALPPDDSVAADHTAVISISRLPKE